jgi:integrase
MTEGRCTETKNDTEKESRRYICSPGSDEWRPSKSILSDGAFAKETAMGRSKKAYSLLKPDSHSPYFRVRWRDSVWRSTHSLGTNDESKALRLAAELYREKSLGAGRVSFEKYAKDFFTEKCGYLLGRHDEGYDMPKKTIAQHRAHLTKYILPHFGKMLLSDIQPRHFDVWRRDLPLSASTRNHIRNTMKIVMGQALYDGMIQRNPIALTRPLSKRTYKRRDVFTDAELDVFLPEDETKLIRRFGRFDWALLFLILAKTGIRSGEVRGLKWDRVLLDQGVAVIDRAIKCDGQLGCTKTGNFKIAILPERAVDMLRRWKEQSSKHRDDDYVFPGNVEGQPLSKETIIERFHAALAKASINLDRSRNLVPHSFRHSFITKISRILPPELVNMLSGHASDQMRVRYTHSTVDDLIARLGPYKDAFSKLMR